MSEPAGIDVTDLSEEGLLAALGLAFAAEMRNVHRDSWYELDTVRSTVPDTTGGHSDILAACPKSWRPTTAGLPTAPGGRAYVCTRLAGHTGRHATGNGTRVLAVWGDPK